MTINSEVRVAGPFLGNDVAVDFPFTFKVFAADEVLVVRASEEGVELVLGLNVDYTVALNVDQEAAPGGVVTLLAGPLPSGESLTLTSALAPLQPVDLTNQGGFYPRVINAALDRLTILIQQLSERLGRSLVVPISDGEPGGTLPGANERKGTVLAFSEATGAPQAGPTIAAVGTVAANTAVINTVASGIADVQTVAANVADVTNFADVYYGPSANDPTTRRDGTPLQVGDLYFNTTIDALRSFNGSAWRGIPNGSITVQNLSGDGIETEFLLNYAPENEEVTSVFISGVYQQKNTYQLGGAGGAWLIFDEAPPVGADNIEVVVSALQPSDDKLRQDLANSTDPATGAGLVGYSDAIAYAAGSVGRAIRDIAAQMSPFTVNVRANGAVGDGVADDTAAIRACIAALKAFGGGTLYFPQGRYKVSTPDTNLACLWIDFDGVRITGDGYLSEIFTEQNGAVPIHVSSQESLATPVSAGAVIDGFVCENIHVRGTGVYEYFALAKGRGILIRRAKNCVVRNCLVSDMSMIGICTESGQGYFAVTGNRVRDCKYTAINYNGRAYGSLIEGNICSGSNAGANSLAIQATGPCIIWGNTVYGDVTNFANCGGIGWGEGPYDGIGTIQGNLVMHCRWGIKAVYHGACNITGNVLINCRTTGGINAVGGATGGFTVASANNLIANNLMVNCAPYQIECSAAGSSITGNRCLNITSPTAPSANSEPDYIAPVTVQAGIRVRAENCSITNNAVDGCVRGITTTLGQTDGAIAGNVVRNVSSASYAWEGDSGVFVSAPARERISLGGTSFVERVISGSIPASGYFPAASRWNPSAYTIGQPTGAVALQSRIDSAATTASAGATTVDIVGAANFVAGTNSKVGFKLDNGQYHWTTISANTGNTLTISAAIPAGRSVPAGNPVYVVVWRPEAALA